MEQIPGVQSASVARMAVLTGGARVVTLTVEGRADSGERGQSEGGADRGDAPGSRRSRTWSARGSSRRSASRSSRGRDFGPIDAEDSPLVAVVNETMAKQFFPGEDPLGKRFTTGSTNAAGQWTQVVGIVRDTKYASLGETAQPIVYMPLAQRHETGVTLLRPRHGGAGTAGHADPP